MARKSAGRMINVSISLSAKVGSLSPESLSLFCLLIPHFNAHGKMQANPHLIKGLVCPLVEWLTPEKVEACLWEISDKTSVKFWQDEKGIHYLHSLHWTEHQTLKNDRLGPDHLPSWSCVVPITPGLVPDNPGLVHELSHKGKEREVEEKIEGEEEGIFPSPIKARTQNPNINALFFSLVGKQPNAFQVKELIRMAEAYPQERLEYAFSEAGKAGADLRYVAAVLEGKGQKLDEPERPSKLVGGYIVR